MGGAAKNGMYGRGHRKTAKTDLETHIPNLSLRTHQVWIGGNTLRSIIYSRDCSMQLG